MKLRHFFTLCAAGAFLASFAQSHVEGVEYYKADQFNNARELLERNYNNSGTDKAVADYYLGLIALENGDKAKAAEYFNKGVAENPEYGYNYAGKGALELLNGNAKEASKLFKEGEGKAKKDASYLIAVARAYYDADPVAYAKDIEKYVNNARKVSKNQNPDIYLFDGDIKRSNKDFGGAAGQYEMAASYNPNSAEAYVKYANLFTQVNPQFAITKLTELLNNNPGSALGQRELANAYYNKQDFKKAAQEYGKYVANPNHFKQDEDRYAFLLFYGQDFQKGYDYASKLLAANPGNFTARRYQFMNAAQIPAMKDQLVPMAEELMKMHRENPANKFAAIDYTLIADELSSAKRSDEAVELLKEAIADQPDNANFNKQLAMTFVNLNQLANASDAYEGYLAKSEKPGYNDFIQQATFSYYAGVENHDNPEKAKVYFDKTAEYAAKAGEILPDNYKPVKFQGDIAKQTATTEEGVKSAAQPFYEKAIVMLEASENPARYASDAKEMYNYMGNYYLDQKDKAKAKQYFSKYLEYDPNNEAYRKFVDSL